MTANESHFVLDIEADSAIGSCKHAIPHNDLIGRLPHNIYNRLQDLEKETPYLKQSLQELDEKQGAAKSCSQL